MKTVKILMLSELVKENTFLTQKTTMRYNAGDHTIALLIVIITTQHHLNHAHVEELGAPSANARMKSGKYAKSLLEPQLKLIASSKTPATSVEQHVPLGKLLMITTISCKTY